jgi:hypothetical protein
VGSFAEGTTGAGGLGINMPEGFISEDVSNGITGGFSSSANDCLRMIAYEPFDVLNRSGKNHILACFDTDLLAHCFPGCLCSRVELIQI